MFTVAFFFAHENSEAEANITDLTTLPKEYT